MIGKVSWGVLASTLLAVAFATGCSSTNAGPVLTPLTTVTAMAPVSQNFTLNGQFPSPLSVLVTTSTSPGTTGTPVSGATVTFTAPASGASGGFGSAGGPNFATATTNAMGIATSPNFYSNNTEGNYQIVASAAGANQLSTAIFTMYNTGTPSPITVSGGTPQSTSISTQFQNTLSVTVTDSTGASVGQGLPVTFTASGSEPGTFADTGTDTTTVLTTSSGVATSTPVIAGATPGSFIVTATTVDGDTNSATFNLSNTIVPATITPASTSTPQTAAINTPFAPLTVTVVDASMPTPLPVAGAVVTFSAPSYTIKAGVDSAASGTFPGGTATSPVTTATAFTDVNGVATAPTFTANGLAGGPYNVSATVVVKQGSSISTNFALTNQ